MKKNCKNLLIIGEIKEDIYDELINWLALKCDTFSFCLPNFGKISVTKSNAEIYPEYKIGYVEEDEENKKEYAQYRKRIQKYLENISEHVVESYFDTEYCEMISGYEKEIFVIKFNDSTKQFLKNVNNLYEWLYPKMPEDLCFYIDGKLYMRSITHEKVCEFYSESKELKKFLKGIGLKYYKIKC